jgi:hypothetical protein
MKRWFLAALLALPAVYAIDYAAFKFRGDRALGTVRVKPMYEVKEKNKKLEYYSLPAEDRACTHTLFPQNGGYPTCWWLERHKNDVTAM